MKIFEIEFTNLATGDKLTHYISEEVMVIKLEAPLDDLNLGECLDLAQSVATVRQAPDHLAGTNEGTLSVDAHYSCVATMSSYTKMPRKVIVINNNHGWGKADSIKVAKKNSGRHERGMKYTAYSVPISAYVNGMGGINSYTLDGDIINLGEC